MSSVRATNSLYREPKKLVATGLARAEKGSVGKRPRTVYTISEADRRALAAWPAEPGTPPTLEFQQMLKVFFGEHGHKRTSSPQLEGMRRWADEEAVLHAEVARAYRAGLGRFPNA